MTGIPVTPAQARMVAAAIAEKDRAVRDLTMIVTAISAGHVPDGAALSGVSTELHVVFFTEPDVPVG